jgi:hypothetical protein
VSPAVIASASPTITRGHWPLIRVMAHLLAGTWESRPERIRFPVLRTYGEMAWHGMLLNVLLNRNSTFHDISRGALLFLRKYLLDANPFWLSGNENHCVWELCFPTLLDQHPTAHINSCPTSNQLGKPFRPPVCFALLHQSC